MNLVSLREIITRDYGNIAGMVVTRGGKVVCEEYFGSFTASDSVHVFSVTKSVVSALCGIAIDRGYIDGVDQKIVDIFPEHAADMSVRGDITIENLLTMTAPYRFDAEPYDEFFASADWPEAALRFLGGDGKIGKFRYTPIVGPDILSGILTRLSGQSVLDFAHENLFAPLGINNVPCSILLRSEEEHLAFYESISVSGWAADSNGTNAAAWGLGLSAMDMAKLGQLYLNRGMWEGRRILPAAWVDESVIEHSRSEQIGLSYGYMWWVIDDHTFSAMGDGGNVIYVNTDKELVVAIASVFMPNAKDRIELIKRHIEPYITPV